MKKNVPQTREVEQIGEMRDAVVRNVEAHERHENRHATRSRQGTPRYVELGERGERSGVASRSQQIREGNRVLE